MPVLECHHGHGRARRPLCRSSLWPLVSSACPATTSRLVFETLSSGAVVWTSVGSTDTMPVSGGNTLSCPASISRKRGPRQSAACCGGHTDTDRQTDTARPEGVATAPLSLSRVLTPSKAPKV